MGNELISFKYIIDLIFFLSFEIRQVIGGNIIQFLITLQLCFHKLLVF